MDRFYKYFLIGLSGPILTFLFHVFQKGGLKGIPHLFGLTFFISIGILIAAVITLIVHKFLKQMIIVVLASSIMAEIVLGLLTFTFFYTIANESDKTENIMELLVWTLFWVLIVLPTTISVSFSCAKLVKIRKNR